MTAPDERPRDAAATEKPGVEMRRFIEWADRSPAVTWAGRGGLKERLSNPERFPEDEPCIPGPAGVDRRQSDFEDGYRAAVADLRWLADARDDYDNPDVQRDTNGARRLARYLSSAPDEAWGWLPSWRWDEWAARRMSDPTLQS